MLEISTVKPLPSTLWLVRVHRSELELGAAKFAVGHLQIHRLHWHDSHHLGQAWPHFDANSRKSWSGRRLRLTLATLNDSMSRATKFAESNEQQT